MTAEKQKNPEADLIRATERKRLRAWLMEIWSWQNSFTLPTFSLLPPLESLFLKKNTLEQSPLER